MEPEAGQTDAAPASLGQTIAGAIVAFTVVEAVLMTFPIAIESLTILLDPLASLMMRVEEALPDSALADIATQIAFLVVGATLFGCLVGVIPALVHNLEHLATRRGASRPILRAAAGAIASGIAAAPIGAAAMWGRYLTFGLDRPERLVSASGLAAVLVWAAAVLLALALTRRAPRGTKTRLLLFRGLALLVTVALLVYSWSAGSDLAPPTIDALPYWGAHSVIAGVLLGVAVHRIVRRGPSPAA